MFIKSFIYLHGIFYNIQLVYVNQVNLHLKLINYLLNSKHITLGEILLSDW